MSAPSVLMAGIELNNGDGKPRRAPRSVSSNACCTAATSCFPKAPNANVISLTPPLTISRTDLRRTVAALAAALAEEG